MRSRGLRLTFGAVCCIAIASVAVFLLDSENTLAGRRAAVREFDLRAREATEALGDLRAAQRAYVAAGQDVGSWLPKVDQTMEALTRTLPILRQSAAAGLSSAALDDAEAGVTEFGSVDKRARDYLASGAQLMAADIVFTEGGEAAAGAARQVERARLGERAAFDAFETAWRKRQVLALGGAAGLSLAMVLLLVLAPGKEARDVASRASAIPEGRTEDLPNAGQSADLLLRPATQPEERKPQPLGVPVLRAAAHLCTELGRMTDPEELSTLLGRAADMLNASGLVLWVGTPTGGELSPALAHGYSPEMVARLPAIPRSADNAAAAAYRTGALQIVLSRPGASKGALAAPVLSCDGCVGVLAVEIQDGGEASDTVQALAAIVAAQLSGLLAAAPASDGERAAGSVAV